MAIDFRLTTEQQNLRETARDFAQNLLAPQVPDADATRSPHEAFAKIKPVMPSLISLSSLWASSPRSTVAAASSTSSWPPRRFAPSTRTSRRTAQRDGLACGPERADDSRAERRSRPSDGPSRPLTAAGRWVRGTGCQAKILNCLGAYNVP